MRALTALVWFGCAALGALQLVHQDALVALGNERWAAPAVVVAAVILLALAWGLVTRRHPKLGPVLPVLVFAVWEAPALKLSAVAPAALTPPGRGPNIVLVTLDTFRADRLGAHTPALEAFARTAVRYTQAVTTAPLTAPAHASMLTGVDTPTHGLRRNGLELGQDTVIDAVRAAGWRTGAFLSAHVLDRDTGLAMGFQHYDDRWGWGQRLRFWPAAGWLHLPRRPVHRDGRETVSRALAWLRADDTPALLWVHLYDAHAPYSPGDGFRPTEDTMASATERDQADFRASADHGALAMITHVREHSQTLLYDACIRYVDHLAGEVIAAAGPDAVVIVIADHGESLTEHDYYFNHGAQLYETALHVPMLVRWPGRLEGGVTDDSLVSVKAVARLIRAAAGLETYEAPRAEDAVLAYTTGQEAKRGFGARRLPKGQGKQSAAIRVQGGKLVSAGGRDAEWFDLTTDPGEVDPRPVPPERASQALEVEAAASRAPPPASDAQRERLRALGYVE